MAANGRNTIALEQIRVALTTALNDVFEAGAKARPGVYRSLLKEFKSKTLQYITTTKAGFGEIPKREGELTPIPYDEVVFGPPRISEADGFNSGFKVSREALLALAKSPAGEVSASRIMSMKELVADMRAKVEETKDIYATEPFVNGTSATKTSRWIGKGRDDAALFGAHTILRQPGTSQTNLLGAETLTQAALGRMYDNMATQLRDDGFPMAGGNSFKLVVPASKTLRARQILGTEKENDGNYNNDSIIKGIKFEVVTNYKFPTGYTGYTLMDSNVHQVGFFAPVDPMFDDEYDHDTMGHKWSVYFQFLVDFMDYRGVCYNAG